MAVEQLGTEEDFNRLQAALQPFYTAMKEEIITVEAKYREDNPDAELAHLGASLIASILAHVLVKGYLQGDLPNSGAFDVAVQTGANAAYARISYLNSLKQSETVN